MKRVKDLYKRCFRPSPPVSDEQEELLKYLRNVCLSLRFGVAVMLAAIIILFVLCRLLESVK